MRKKILAGLLLGAGAAALAAGLWLGGALDRLEAITWAWRVGFFAAREAPSPAIKTVLLDQPSLDWGQAENQWPWPWPREVYGPVLAYARRTGARGVAFDMLYTEPSIHGVYDDEAFGAAIQGAPPFVAAAFFGRDAGLTTNWPPFLAPPPWQVEGWDAWRTANGARAPEAARATFPVPPVATNATALANVMDVPDADGVFRRTTLFRVFDGRWVPSLGLAAYLAARAAEGAPPALRLEPGWLRVGDLRVPVDRRGRAILRFKGRQGTHASVSAAAVIQSELRLQAGEAPPLGPSNFFARCFVFFGPSAPSLLDNKPTPVSDVFPGVEIHAAVLDSLLTGDFLRDAPPAAAAAALLALGLLAGIAGVLARRAVHSVALFLLLLPLPAAGGFAAYTAGVWWPVVAPTAAAALALVGAVIYNYATEGRQKAFLKGAFKYYLSPAVIERIIQDPGQLRLGGEKRELSIFFSDLQGFSSISEKLDPPALTTLLNDYLSDMTDIILEEGGTLDKYEGDAIIAFWNAPLAQPDHAVRACRTALRCQRRLAARRAEFEQRTGAVLRMRIGINTGDVVVGNMGSGQRFNYTILGDAANLASRLEGANKALGTYLMIAESTWSRTGGAFPGRELAQLRVVGRQAPVRVFEALGLPGEPAPALAAAFDAALALCRAGRRPEAQRAFEQLQAEDPAAARYADKLRALADSPGATWDGIWNLTEK